MDKRTAALLVSFTILVTTIDHAVRADYMLDDSVGLGRMFDGTGGLSAGVSQIKGGALAPRYSYCMLPGMSYPL